MHPKEKLKEQERCNLIHFSANLRRKTIAVNGSTGIVSFQTNARSSLRHFVPSHFKTATFWIVFFVLFCNCFLLSAARYSTKNLAESSRNQRIKRRIENADSSGCEKIEIPLCQDVGYNLTDMSLSPANMVEQTDAAIVVKEFTLLVESACAEEMKLLLCSIYAPICLSTYSNFLPPCRHICEKAKEGCEPVLAQYQFEWPELLRCENFPIYFDSDQLCLHFNRSTEHKPPTSGRLETLRLSPQPRTSNFTAQFSRMRKQTNRTVNEGSSKCYCKPPMVSIQDTSDLLYNKVETGSVMNCAFPCRSPYFTKKEKQLTKTFITVLSVVCFVVTLATVGTFLVDAGRFKYPERPVVFLSICHLFVSMGYLIRLAAGHEAVACGLGSDRILYHTTGPFLCSTVFLLTYFFGMAGALWWVILTFTWFLAAGLKWGNEAITNCSKYFHIVSWFIPGLQSVMVFVTSAVDGDALAGICFVGSRDVMNLNRFVLVPFIVYLAMGGFFLLLGIVSLFNIRTSIKKVGKITQPLDKLMGRIGCFSLVYIALSCTLLVCYFYEQKNRIKWETSHNCPTIILTKKGRVEATSSNPHFTVMITKYSVVMLIGILNGLWICSAKTVESWVRFYHQNTFHICGPTGLVAWFKKTGRRGKRTNHVYAASKSNYSPPSLPGSLGGTIMPNHGWSQSKVSSSSRDDIEPITSFRNKQAFNLNFKRSEQMIVDAKHRLSNNQGNNSNGNGSSCATHQRLPCSQVQRCGGNRFVSSFMSNSNSQVYIFSQEFE